MEDLKALKQSAESNAYKYDNPDKSLLETFNSPSYPGDLEVDIETDEFTCLCPITGQPDYGTIRVRYWPNQKCVESKSFKLYLMQFRNHGSFHEAITAKICADLVEVLSPQMVTVQGRFKPRGGIQFWPTASYHSQEK
jgi:7-cyano-7-deazaguanine reductase